MENKQFYENLYGRMEDDLTAIEMKEHSPMQRLKFAHVCVEKYINMLKDYLASHPFTGTEEEIHFFKHTKPRFYRWHIYYHETATLDTGLPIGSRNAKAAYLKLELSHIERFFRQYQFLYQYYAIGASDLDTLYFTRGAATVSDLLPFGPTPEPQFSTRADYLFASFMAREMLRERIVERLSMLKKARFTSRSHTTGRKMGEIRWTGDTIHLAELGYGLYLTRQLSGGTATINEIFQWLEENLHVTIGKPAKRLSEIKGRKRLSQTKFIDEMKDSIHRKIERDDEYRPNQGK